MKKLVIYHGDNPECVEGFPKDCKRSCKGSLHLQKGKTKTLTDGEYKYICESKRYKHLKGKIRVVSELKEEVAKPKAASPPKKEAPQKMDNQNPMESKEHSGKKKNKKR